MFALFFLLAFWIVFNIGLFQFDWFTGYEVALWLSLILVAKLSFISRYILFIGSKSAITESFIFYAAASMGFKFMTTLLVVAIYIFIADPQNRMIALPFFAYYASFSALIVYQIVMRLGKVSK